MPEGEAPTLMPHRPTAITMDRYSGLRLLTEALRGHRGWRPAWRDAAPKASYKIVIVGGGGQGLATAYNLATQYGIGDVAVLERGAIGLGNVGRNTTIIRSNYFSAENIRFFETSLKLWERFEQDVNFNAMVSQRGTATASAISSRAGPTPCASRAWTRNISTRKRSSALCR
jgi:sarcosine oxidase subunit beta